MGLVGVVFCSAWMGRLVETKRVDYKLAIVSSSQRYRVAVECYVGLAAAGRVYGERGLNLNLAYCVVVRRFPNVQRETYSCILPHSLRITVVEYS